MIIVRNDEEIDKLREAGRIVGLTHIYNSLLNLGLQRKN